MLVRAITWKSWRSFSLLHHWVAICAVVIVFVNRQLDRQTDRILFLFLFLDITREIDISVTQLCGCTNDPQPFLPHGLVYVKHSNVAVN